MAPSGVNNSARAVMGAVRRFYDTVYSSFLPLTGGTITGSVTINSGTLTANGDLSVGNNANVAGTLTAGTVSTDALTVNLGPLTANGDLSVGNNASVAGTLTAGNLSAPNATIGTNLTAGNLSVTSNASVAGTLTTNTITAGLYKGSSTVNIYENVNHTFRGNDLSSFAIFNAAGTYNWSGSWLTLLDAACKTDIQDYNTRGLSEVQALRPVSFRYSGGPFASEETRYGLIAQEVAKIVPEMVGEAEFGDGPVLTTQPSHLIWLLVRSCQELAARVEVLEGATHAR